VEARVRCCLCSCGICGGKIGIKIGLSLTTWVSLSITIPPRGSRQREASSVVPWAAQSKGRKMGSKMNSLKKKSDFLHSRSVKLLRKI